MAGSPQNSSESAAADSLLASILMRLCCRQNRPSGGLTLPDPPLNLGGLWAASLKSISGPCKPSNVPCGGLSTRQGAAEFRQEHRHLYDVL